MVMLKSLRNKKGQAHFVFITIIVLISILLIGSVFILFTEIKNNNIEFSKENDLQILGEKVASSIIEVYSTGENIQYNGSNKELVSRDLKIDDKCLEYIIRISSDKVVITHQDKKKEIKLHNLNNIELEGSARGKNIINLAYYKNWTSKKIILN